MKISVSHASRQKDGMAVIVVIAILSILLIFISGNLRTLHLLRADLRLIETHQTNRLATLGPIPYAPPATNQISTPADSQHP